MANFKGITLPDGTTYFPEVSGSTIDTVSVSVDNNTGVPSATGSVSGTTLNLDFKNLKGETGSTGPKGDTGQGVPAGGTAGQVLKKKSGTDYDTEWADDTGGGTAEKEWTYLYDEILSEETAILTNDGLDFQEIEAFIALYTGYENATTINFTSGYNNIYTNPLVQTQITSNFVGIIYSKLEVITGNLWKGYRAFPAYFGMANYTNLSVSFGNQYLGEEINIPNITAFTLQANNPLPVGTRVIVRGR